MPSEPIRNVVVVSDTHSGCRLGLCPDQEIPLDDGGTYSPSPLQRKLWAQFRHFFDVDVPRLTRGEPWVLVHNGDAVEGVHHRAVTPISHNMEDQLAIARACLFPEVKKAAAYYQVRGTEAHVGSSAQHEERLARGMGAVPNEFDQFSQWELWLVMGGHRIYFTHHISAVGAANGEATAPHRKIVDSQIEGGRWGDAPPRVIVSSHRHEEIVVGQPAQHGMMWSVTTPAWQLKSPYVYKKGGMRQPLTGGIVIRLDEDGEPEIKTRFWHIERPREVSI